MIDLTSIKSLLGSGECGGISMPGGSSNGSSIMTVCVILRNRDHNVLLFICRVVD